jgi:hypothetical protein
LHAQGFDEAGEKMSLARQGVFGFVGLPLARAEEIAEKSKNGISRR